MFEALFKCVSARFGLRTIEKSVENPDFIFCSPFQNEKTLQTLSRPQTVFVWVIKIACPHIRLIMRSKVAVERMLIVDHRGILE